MAAQPDYDYLFKILIIGDSGVGKSSLLLRYTDNAFASNYVATIGVDFKIKTVDIDGERVKLQIWDTAGQERFRTITATYYRGAHGIIVVYDVNDGQSFGNVKRWFSEINNHCPEGISKIIVGNKDDTPDAKQVPSEDLTTVANEFGVPCVEASAKLNVKVDNIFSTLTSNIIRSGIVERAAARSNASKPVKVTKIRPGGGGRDEKKKCC